MARLLRSHQRQIDAVMQAISSGTTEVSDILAAVTPGGGKSLLPVIAAARLVGARIVDRICWVVPRDTLRLQAEEAFADHGWRKALGHAITVRAADNGPDPCRGLGGYVTTYQSVAAAPALHLAEFRRHRYLIAVDELHHLPALNDFDPLSPVADETAWSRALAPLLESAPVRLLMSGTLERADGRAILWLPYRSQPRPAGGGKRWRRIDFDAPGWAVVGYSRRQALAEKAVIPVQFGALDGQAEWKPKKEGMAPAPEGPVKISAEPEIARYALYAALRTGYAEEMLREAFDACRRHRAMRRTRMHLEPGTEARGLGKLLVVASDQTVARSYAEILRSWLPEGERSRSVRLAVSDVSDAQEAIASFRMRPEPAVLVTVAMAYEGMDCPEITHVACMTHIRSRPWLEQMIARATRVDPDAGRWEGQKATVYHPDDIMFRVFRKAIETEQGTRARYAQGEQRDLFDRTVDPDAENRDWGLGIEPLRSNALALRFDRVRPGVDFGNAGLPAAIPGADGLEVVEGLPREKPAEAERRLRQRLGQMVAAQVVEDEDNRVVQGGPVGYHGYNAVLKQVTGGRGRSEMSQEQLEAAIGWLERNRLSDHLAVLEEDTRYKWSERRRRDARSEPGAWMAKMERLERKMSQAAEKGD